METAEEIFKKKYEEKSGKLADEVVMHHMEYAIEAMEEYARQQENYITELFTKPTEELIPLIEVWCKENNKLNVLPDTKGFYKWITEKILNNEKQFTLEDIGKAIMFGVNLKAGNIKVDYKKYGSQENQFIQTLNKQKNG